jgi:uncharacterized protein involved in exopolysaccharide biosynthesis
MQPQLLDPTSLETETQQAEPRPAAWVENTEILWRNRRILLRAAAIALAAGIAIALLIPRRYTSTARIMPPDNSSSNMAVVAALAGRNLGELGGLSSLAGSLLGSRNTSALFVDLLRSGTISGDLIDRFRLEKVWRKRYRIDTAKALARETTITDDKRSGVITVQVEDTDPVRARDLAQGYLDELDLLVTRTNTSSAHQERVFIERRLSGVQNDLLQAQKALSDFSSTHATIDLPDQTRAMVDAAARLQAEQIAEQSELDSLRQIYGDTNVRVRAAEARVAEFQRQLLKLSGSSAPPPDSSGDSTGQAGDSNELYPPLRQLPHLAVPYSELYRRVRVQETLYELLTQQYELTRIEEARDVPVVSIIDRPGIPEKKSFPPRTLLTLLFTLFVVSAAAAFLLFRHRWSLIDPADPRKLLAREMTATLQTRLQRLRSLRGGRR